MGFYELGALIAFIIASIGISIAALKELDKPKHQQDLGVFALALIVLLVATLFSWIFVVFAGIYLTTKHFYNKNKKETK